MKKNKYVILSIIILSILIFSSSCTQKKDFSTFKIVLLDVGKADAIILKTENHTILIDTGYDESSSVILEYFHKEGINTIDYLIITHFDKDHIGASDKILRGMTVKNVIEPDYEEDNSQYEGYIKALSKVGITPIVAHEKLSFELDLVSFDIYPSEKTDYDNVNNYSLVTSVHHGKKSFLFAGDIVAKRITELFDNNLNLKYNFLKVPHHGDYNKKSTAFFEAVSPKYAVITCSKEDPASDETITALEKTGAKIYYTSNGNIECLSDGYSLQINQPVE